MPGYGLLLVYLIPVDVLHRQREQHRLVKADPNLSHAVSWTIHVANLAHVTLAAGLLEWGTTAFCQYIFLVGTLYEAIRRWICYWVDADAFRLGENVPETTSDRNMRLAMQWQTPRYFGLLVAAVAVMRFGSLDEWIAMRALTPVAACYYWTLRATWDYSTLSEAGVTRTARSGPVLPGPNGRAPS